MPNSCSVKDCYQGVGEVSFSVPKVNSELYKKWATILRGKTKRPLKPGSTICEKHFGEDSVDSFFEIVSNQQMPKKKLKKNAVPFTKYQDAVKEASMLIGDNVICDGTIPTGSRLLGKADITELDQNIQSLIIETAPQDQNKPPSIISADHSYSAQSEPLVMNKTTVPVDVEIIDEPASKKSRFGSETVFQNQNKSPPTVTADHSYSAQCDSLDPLNLEPKKIPLNEEIRELEPVLSKKSVSDLNPPTVTADHSYSSVQQQTIIPAKVFPISFDRLKLPNDYWKIMPHVPGTSKLLICELVSTGPISFASRKSVQVDFQERSVRYRITDVEIHSDRLPTKFASPKALENLIDWFHETKECQGITNNEYHAISDLNIPSGSFNDGTWRSNGCLHIFERSDDSQREMLPLCFPCKSFKRVVLRRRLLKHSSNASLQPKITTTNRLLSHDELLAKIASTTKEKRALSLQLTRKTEEANKAKNKIIKLKQEIEKLSNKCATVEKDN